MLGGECIMRKARYALLAAAALTFATGASAANDAPRLSRGDDCVFIRTINDFRPLDRNRLVIWAPGRRNAFLVELAGGAPDLRFAHRLAVVDRNGDGRLCGFGMDRIVIPDSHMPMPATIIGMSRLDDTDIARLEAEYDVRLTRRTKAAQ
jgi:hypothetical protein